MELSLLACIHLFVDLSAGSSQGHHGGGILSTLLLENRVSSYGHDDMWLSAQSFPAVYIGGSR